MGEPGRRVAKRLKRSGISPMGYPPYYLGDGRLYYSHPMSDDIAEYTALYAKYFGGLSLDRGFYLKWIRAANQRTPIAFENYVINSPEYGKHLYSQFKGIYSYLIEPTVPQAVFDDFAKKYGGQVGRTLVNEASITAYVKDLPVFKEKYVSVISRLYSMVNGGEAIPENLLALYLEKFQTSTTEYTLDDLNDDIMKGRAPAISGGAGAGATNVLQDIKAKWAQIQGGVPTSHILNNLLTQLGDADYVLACLIKQYNLFRNNQVADVQQRFLAEYGREPYVPEFLKIVEQGITDLAAMHAYHQKQLIVVKDLYRSYVATDIPEVEFVKLYIYAIDDAGYTSDIVDDLTASAAYETEMRAAIRKVFKQMFDIPLPAEDETYMFEQIKGKKIDLQSHQIAEIVTALKIETDNYLASLEAVYTGILKRSPDVLECIHYKAVYRDDHDAKKTEGSVRGDLYASLEYHDVLKAKIRDLYEGGGEAKKLLPSKLFAILNAVLKDEGLMKNDVALEAFIKGC